MYLTDYVAVQRSDVRTPPSLYDLGLFLPTDYLANTIAHELSGFIKARLPSTISTFFQNPGLPEVRKPSFHAGMESAYEQNGRYYHRDVDPEWQGARSWTQAHPTAWLLVWANVFPTDIVRCHCHSENFQWVHGYDSSRVHCLDPHPGERVNLENGHVYLFNDARYIHRTPWLPIGSNRWFARGYLYETPVLPESLILERV